MPSIVKERPQDLEIAARRKKWTRAECDVFQSTGLWNQDNLELVEGELLTKMPKNRPHVYAVMILIDWLIQTFGVQLVNSEAPIDVAPQDYPTSRPEPDAVVLLVPSREIGRRDPRHSEIQLVIEVSDTTAAYDLSVKADLYARAGIPEYWVIDLSSRRVVVHRSPANGAYASVEQYAENESVSSLAKPQAALSVAALFLP